MSISVSRESISKLMTELVDSFPMEGEGRASISDFGKLLFAEGQTSTTAASNGNSSVPAATSTPSDAGKDADSTGSGSDQDSSSSAPSTQTGSKRVFTEIKGVPRQKQHDIMKSKDKAVPKRWTQEEDDRLRDAVSRHGERNWKSIAEEVPGRNHTQCLQRWTKVLAPGLVKGHWRPDEDELLKELVAEGRKNWGQVATRIPGRTSKQCRERWYNHLDPSIVRGEYTAEEDRIILDAQSRLGNRWSAIAAMLPGRTEDAVKIRWKSLCRVRKGQGRRAQADKNKKDMDPLGGGVGVVNGGGDTGNGMPMLHHPLAPNNGGFAGNLVKSEEVGSFSSMPTHPPQMLRLASGQLVPAAAAYAPNNAPAPGMPPTMPQQSSATTAMMSMMYASPAPSDMSGGGYDPTMAHYRKPPMAPPHVVNNYAHMSIGGGVVNASNMPPNAASASSVPPSAMGIPSPSNGGGYAQPYGMAGPNGSYATDMNMYGGGNVNASAGAVYGVVASPQMSMYRPPTGMMMSPQVSPQHQQQSPHQHQMMGGNGSAYGYGLPATPTNGGGMMQQSSGFNPAAAFVQQHQQHQQHQQRENYMNQHQSGLMSSTTPTQEQDQPNPEAPPSPPIADQKATEASAPPAAPTSRPMANPAAMFVQRQAANKMAPAPSVVQPMMAGNPVAAFLQQQQLQKRKEQPTSTASSSTKPAAVSSSSSTSSSGPVKPFNPALAFAQRMQASSSSQKPPPMPLSTKSSEGDTADEEEDDGGDARGREPSLKKVKPRLSIDAARASAARRLRNSGSGTALAGRPSLEGFLNEIGDVGRLSDLKMEEFQTLDELWRVSGDMDRLSL